MNCSLCQASSVSDFDIKKLKYWHCADCRLTFLDPEFYLSPAEEKARYDCHENSADDPEYIRFLNRLADPLLARLRPEDEGLDFGCGPGPAMSVILKKEGFLVDNYDPHYFSDLCLLGRKYNFVTCTEVVEHFKNPRKDFELLAGLLKPGGRIGIMTEMLTPEVKFEHWHYRLDPTHVAFYRPETFDWISRWQGLSAEYPVKNVVIFHNKEDV
ncbi:MAG: class I SAM-dependent methyltransferase [Candidatus Omnitrophica bacterium]|nr:class I SAM-dependent methyltransferase [Candidatus Omnitrophota bacterium]